MTEKNMEDAKLVCFRSVVLLQDWITCKALALEEKSWTMDQTAEQKYLALISHLTRSCITSDILKSVTTLIFDKAILEPTFCPMYAQLCCDICDKMPTFPSSKITFKRVLLNTIQNVFEGTDELSNEIRKMNAPDQEEERRDTERLSKLRTLGNLRLCGELFLKRKIRGKIVHHIVQKLLGDDEKMCPSEENLEAVCLFLKTVGKKLDGSESVESSLSLTSSKLVNDVYFRRLESLSPRPQMSMRIKFMIRNIIDLRSNHWIPAGKSPTSTL
ncbi:eukaryotic translation initiation factor isoform X1 [Arabidopsis lyrata subsp. lyrata]|nr:eukaryotic translation initiation factor isoform X1 [Arabidopsis lyrata subsp. lyrata]XP_020891749.1 eukaryotic translation initiation factor isoform X1 [Arabidopsis lyrata subsp. lyrata]|eukprot:XP_002888026.2 eukaryotic translation initiation factor isoform X1 [Arabidopsis lyrata subsp. lyrata]